ncbi:sigma-54-dependent Fis family transcriptional regulator [Aromatoleum diolicum]
MVIEGQSRHIERVNNVISGRGHPSRMAEPDEAIRRSWMRCASSYGLDPARPEPAQIITSSQLREHKERIDEFLRVARSGMEQLYKQVASLGYVLLLSDGEGVTVDYIANAGGDAELKAAGVYVGADWKENHAGTNGIGAVIAERTPLICHQEDHFNVKHIGLSCTAAPIFDPRGDLLAVLNITAMNSPRSKDSQYLALQLTALHARAIEDANFILRFGDQWILRLCRTWAFAEVSGEMMLAFNDEGVIVGANTTVRRELASAGQPSDWIIGRAVPEVFECTMDDIWRAARGVGSDNSVMTADGQNLYYLSVRLPRRQKDLRVIFQEKWLPSQLGAEDHAALDSLAGDDPVMQRTLEQAKRLVNRKVNILIQGETGSGKEIFARALHKSSTRARKPFVALNCAAIPESLIESELFGYAPGSFTGGRSKGMKGLIQQSDGGTLFLDEIGDMPLHLQTRLLRVLSESEVMPIGAEKPVRVELTVIAASHRDLRTMIADGKFREDLYYRLGGATLYLPSLRERKDIGFIIERLLRAESEAQGGAASISSAALEALTRYSWPGNIRELRNALRYALALSEDGEIRVQDLPRELVLPRIPAVQLEESPWPGRTAALPTETPAEPKGEELLRLLRRHKWNITATAAELGVSRVTIYRQMKRFGIVPPNETH